MAELYLPDDQNMAWRIVRGEGHQAGKAGLKFLTIAEEKTNTIDPILAAGKILKLTEVNPEAQAMAHAVMGAVSTVTSC